MKFREIDRNLVVIATHRKLASGMLKVRALYLKHPFFCGLKWSFCEKHNTRTSPKRSHLLDLVHTGNSELDADKETDAAREICKAGIEETG
jgi:hypothetical protein